MTLVDNTAPAQSDSLAFEFDLQHPPENVWRALTDPALLTQWLLPVVELELELEPGTLFSFRTDPQPGWDGVVNCQLRGARRTRGPAAARFHHLLAVAATFPADVHRIVPVRASVCFQLEQAAAFTSG